MRICQLRDTSWHVFLPSLVIVMVYPAPPPPHPPTHPPIADQGEDAGHGGGTAALPREPRGEMRFGAGFAMAATAARVAMRACAAGGGDAAAAAKRGRMVGCVWKAKGGARGQENQK